MSDGHGDKMTIDTIDHMCKGGKEHLQTVRHNTPKIYARR